MNKKKKLNFFNVNNSLIELKKRIFFVITSIIIFRIGSFIPIPGINSSVLSDFLRDQKGTIIDMFNMFSGGALSRASIFSLGIMPYISSSIIIQLLTLFNSRLSELQKEGELGKNIINQYTRYITFLLSILQAIGIASTLPNISGMKGLVPNPNFLFYFIAVISLVTGTMLLMWLGELITERGIGNGISIIIFVGIISGLPSVFCNFFEEIRQQKLNFLILFYIFMIIFFVTFLVIFIERSYRKIVLHYPKQNKHYNIYTTQSTHLPLKVNMSGIMPAIFSSSIIMFPVTLFSWINIDNKYIWLTKIIFYLQPGNLLYIIIYSGLIIFFCFFYSNLMFNPRETAEKLKKSGAFIPGIRPGEQTAKYISNIMYKLIFIGSLYIIIICLIPDLMKMFLFVPFYFGGTSLLIVVLVIIDFIMQIQTLMMSSQYHSILKKNNFNFKIMH